jgi:nucleoside 2-deoxyribosyltransferase
MQPDSKRARTVFVAYPYRFGQPYRDALANRFEGSAVEFRYADDMLLNVHVMEKIRRMMSEVDVCLFDVTDCNPNVMLELGYALGAEEPAFVVVKKDAVNEMSADIVGWDTLRYDDFGDLAEKVHHHVSTKRVLLRRAVERITIAEPDPRERLRDLRFGIPAVSDPLLVVYTVPDEYERYYKNREILGKPPYRAQDLCESVQAGPNRTGYRTFFWHGGFDYAPRPGRDFVEVYEGRGAPSQTERITNFRVYTSGAVTYMQRMRLGGEHYKPFLYLYMFENIVEMALVAAAEVRQKWGFNGQGRVNVGAVFLHAAELHISDATPDHYPAGDTGRRILSGEEIWVPDEPILVDGDELGSRAGALANEIVADLESKRL